MDLQIESVSVDAVIRDVVRQLETGSRSPEVELVLRLPASVGAVRTDRQKLKHVLMNILDNALKFTKQGMIAVELVVDGDGQPIRIDITDSGGGMPPERVNEIFEPFRQLETRSKEQPSGTGLGLSICRSFCDLMGYRLDVRSEVGRGSTFSIVLAERSRLPLSA